jgi:hypothetical protein
MTPTANHHDNDTRDEPSRLYGLTLREWPRPRLRRTAMVTGALVGLVVMAAGCGGSWNPGVAHLGKSSGGSREKGWEAFARCMRAHGEPSFPDPSSKGGFDLSGVDQNSPQFQSAAGGACASLEPHNLTPPAAQQAARAGLEAGLRFAHCMRAHGISNFPDPKQQGAGGIVLATGPGAGINPNSPQLKRAQQACRSLSPGGASTHGGSA